PQAYVAGAIGVLRKLFPDGNVPEPETLYEEVKRHGMFRIFDEAEYVWAFKQVWDSRRTTSFETTQKANLELAHSLKSAIGIVRKAQEEMIVTFVQSRVLGQL